MGKKTDTIKAYLRDNPDTPTTIVAKELSVSTRMVRYVKEAVKKATNGVKAKLLLVDVETSPMEVYVWGLYKQRIPTTNVIKDWALLSWAAKWLNEDEVMSEHVNIDEAHARDDGSIIGSLWKLLDTADVVIAHNAASFDIRKMNARFIENGYLPPSSFQVIDTLKISRKYFGFSSHKLDYVSELLGGITKMETKFELWIKCVTGDADALKYMQKYNKQDVLILEDLYLELRPWVKSHANMGLFVDGDAAMCANCGSTDLDWKYSYQTPVNSYPSYRCKNCGAIGRSRFSTITKEKRKNLTVSVAR